MIVSTRKLGCDKALGLGGREELELPDRGALCGFEDVQTYIARSNERESSGEIATYGLSAQDWLPGLAISALELELADPALIRFVDHHLV